MKKILIMFLLVIVALVGCTTTQPSTPETHSGNTNTGGSFQEFEVEVGKEIETKTFTSEEEFMQFVKQYQGNNYYYGGVRMFDAVEESAVADAAAPAIAKTSGGSDFSETNVQVEGIDEADILKTDGEYIYTITEKTLFIIKAYPGKEAEVVAELELDHHPSGLFINNDKLAIFGTAWYPQQLKDIDIRTQNSMTFYNVYDIKDKKNPSPEKEYWFEGNYFNGRMKENFVYVVTQSSPFYRTDFPTPLIIEDEVARSVPVNDIHYYPIGYEQPQFVTIHAIDMNDLSNTNQKTIAVEGSRNLYMSTENMYLTFTEYVNEWKLQQQITMKLLESKLSEKDKELIQKIKETDNSVLSQGEKEQKIYNVYNRIIQFMSYKDQEDFNDKVQKELSKQLEEFEHMEYTVINKVEIDGEKITPAANGKVPGRVINQFALDEHEDTLRIATTISARWNRFGKQRTQSTNNIYTLDKNLELLDKLEGLAEGEQIYSTRFMGERLYMVTFRQIDPFFVIDLSNPSNIKELGELKIPGFSRYLHPYDENTIIGIGQDATDEGRTTGLKISLFDVTDTSKPKEVAQFVTEERYAHSTALYEHKAFLFSKEKNLLVIPAYSYDYRDEESGYNGAFVFDITKDEIELRGLIDHSNDNQYWSPTVERSLYIEELLYTKSRNLLRINKLEDLSSVKSISLKTTDTDIPIY